MKGENILIFLDVVLQLGNKKCVILWVTKLGAREQQRLQR